MRCCESVKKKKKAVALIISAMYPIIVLITTERGLKGHRRLGLAHKDCRHRKKMTVLALQAKGSR